MGNPYYTPPPDPIAPIMKQATSLLQFKQNRDAEKLKLAQDQKYKEADLSIKYQNMLTNMDDSARQQQTHQLDVRKQQQAENETAQHLRPYRPTWHNQRMVRLKKALSPEVANTLKPLTDTLENLAGEGKSFMDVYRDVRPAMKYHAKQILPKMKTMMERKMEDPNWASSVAGQNFMRLYDELATNPEGVADQMFGATLDSYKQEQTKRQLDMAQKSAELIKTIRTDPSAKFKIVQEIAAVEQAPNDSPLAKYKPYLPMLKKAVSDAEQWGDVYTGEYGNKLQRNVDTNQVRTVEKVPTGALISQGSDGALEVQTGVPMAGSGSPQALARKTIGNLEESIMNGNQMYSQIALMEDTFNRTLYEIPHRISVAISKGKDWVGMSSPEDREKINEFTDHIAVVGKNFAEQIRIYAGTAATKAEMANQLPWLLKAGKNIFDGDTPQVAIRKLAQMKEFVRKTIARNTYVRRNGFARIEEVPLGSINTIINDRAAELEAKLKESGLFSDQQQLEAEVQKQITRIFGLEF
jgi:hypothetical protein